MARPRRRRQLVAAGVVLVFVTAIVIGAVEATGGTGPAASSGTPAGSATGTQVPPTSDDAPTTTLVPAAADVAAARACQAFTVYLLDAENGRVPAPAGRALADDAAVLVRGARQDRAAGRAEPRWSTLGADLLAAAEDIVDHESESLQTDGAEAGAQCREIPPAAAAAGGFQRSS